MEVVEDDQWSTLDREDQDSVLASSLPSQASSSQESAVDQPVTFRETGVRRSR